MGYVTNPFTTKKQLEQNHKIESTYLGFHHLSQMSGSRLMALFAESLPRYVPGLSPVEPQ